ncbi:MAG: hypothetical protein K8T89_17835 [Planctomycetes bacterium]|nr:hypothetical protein [Planctomycetota bacterium]
MTNARPLFFMPVLGVEEEVAIGVECPCGKTISNWKDNVPFLADFLPEQHADSFCGVIEDAVRDCPGPPEIVSAWAIDSSVELFRQIWQCPSCGRILVMGADRRYYSFVPESPTTPRDLLAGEVRRASGHLN